MAAADVVLLATGASADLMAATYDAAQDTWTVQSFAGNPSVSQPDVTLTGAGTATGVFRFTELGNGLDQAVMMTTLAAGTWSAPVRVGGTALTQGRPAVGANGSGVRVAYHDAGDFNFYDLAGDFSTPGAVGAFGPITGDLCVGAATHYLFSNGAVSNELYARTFAAGVWGAETPLAVGVDFGIRPTLVCDASADVASGLYVASGTGQVMLIFRAAGTWVPSGAVDNMFTSLPPSVALGATSLLPAVAITGNDGNLYISQFTGAAWSAPEQVDTGITGAPSLVTGVGTAELEVVYVKAGQATHKRNIGGVWGAALVVGGAGLERLEAASTP